MGEPGDPLAVEKKGETGSKEESICRSWGWRGKENTASEETSSASVTGEKEKQQNEKKQT